MTVVAKVAQERMRDGGGFPCRAVPFPYHRRVVGGFTPTPDVVPLLDRNGVPNPHDPLVIDSRLSLG